MIGRITGVHCITVIVMELGLYWLTHNRCSFNSSPWLPHFLQKINQLLRPVLCIYAAFVCSYYSSAVKNCFNKLMLIKTIMKGYSLRRRNCSNRQRVKVMPMKKQSQQQQQQQQQMIIGVNEIDVDPFRILDGLWKEARRKNNINR